jgi:hypothetical protein
LKATENQRRKFAAAGRRAGGLLEGEAGLVLQGIEIEYAGGLDFRRGQNLHRYRHVYLRFGPPPCSHGHFLYLPSRRGRCWRHRLAG